MAVKQAVRVGLIGVGGIVDYVHFPGLKTVPGVEVVGMTDADAALLERRRREWHVAAYADDAALLEVAALDAVVIATPNYTHRPLALAAFRAGKHVLCEKPIALSAPEAREMLDAARAAGVRHMTAFTYRFVPAMRFLKRVVERGDLGEPLHFRAQRFQDWPETSVGWRQWRETAGTGELGDMASHRIDYARFLLGEISAVCGMTKQFVARDRDAEGRAVRPSDTDDWVAMVFELACGATGVIESSKLARGHGSGGHGHDYVEINGTEASAFYRMNRPYELQIGRRGSSFATAPATFETVEVPREFWKVPGSLRAAGEGDPARVWRWDQEVEFITAIREGRDCSPSFADGLRCQAVIDAVVQSVAERRCVEVGE